MGTLKREADLGRSFREGAKRKLVATRSSHNAADLRQIGFLRRLISGNPGQAPRTMSAHCQAVAGLDAVNGSSVSPGDSVRNDITIKLCGRLLS
jgi:hypothetical protein